ncbi:hypothetical protein JKP88DRAFT_267299 [Tribonema minus]|uniref:Uncharacterized protein n=1 Tax=Tribonema minus TaxID=303371 RepID=A0A835ZC04_9STRA|nr:hypothetical protein JKP88DRAFT_267299 [Tribonema minus]
MEAASKQDQHGAADVVLTMAFSVPGPTPQHAFSSRGDEPEYAPTVADADNKYTHAYTGRHDDGALPEMRRGGPHEALMVALMAAQADSDAFLTAVIDYEKQQQPLQQQQVQRQQPSKAPQQKRATAKKPTSSPRQPAVKHKLQTEIAVDFCDGTAAAAQHTTIIRCDGVILK